MTRDTLVADLLAKWEGCWCGPQMAEDHDPRVQDCPQHGDASCQHMAEGIALDLRALLDRHAEPEHYTQPDQSVRVDPEFIEFLNTTTAVAAAAGAQRCTTPDCPGDWRYAAPGRGHRVGCDYPQTYGMAVETGWKSPEYRYLLVTTTDNGLNFYSIFASKEIAKAYVEEQWPETARWYEDVSGDLRSEGYDGGYTWRITSEPYYETEPT